MYKESKPVADLSPANRFKTERFVAISLRLRKHWKKMIKKAPDCAYYVQRVTPPTCMSLYEGSVKCIYYIMWFVYLLKWIRKIIFKIICKTVLLALCILKPNVSDTLHVAVYKNIFTSYAKKTNTMNRDKNNFSHNLFVRQKPTQLYISFLVQNNLLNNGPSIPFWVT